ncbi:MAG: hypothetical protein AMQ74_01665 [Candidatus Methanofastidiosum methylothiophilum]|uniref:Uncharacterized protein n=1 Tax=Candidatus Methanofastidiosum methylothiophilum TaxID=1705564 RepID=A0A150IS10_9EURY|nr:MAG: hypothetical protein AMQ74_01665 [Candidatus Methanofastidiosum methylthiophilus]
MSWEKLSEGDVAIGTNISFTYLAYLNREQLRFLELAGPINAPTEIKYNSEKRVVGIENGLGTELVYGTLSPEILEAIDGLKNENIKSPYIRNVEGTLLLRIFPVNILKRPTTFEEGKDFIERIVKEDNLEELIALQDVRCKDVE